MGKAPAFQFYVKDWLSDPELQSASSSTRGIWINALCYMWESCNRGQISGTIEELSKLLRSSNGDFMTFLEDVKHHKFADVTICNNEITLTNRRMHREQKERDNTRLRVSKFRNKAQSNENVTPPSSSPSSSPKNKDISDDEFLNSLKEKFTWIDFDQTMVRMDAWLMANPGRKKTRRFIVNWLNKTEKPLKIKTNIEGDYPKARDVLKKQGIEYD